MSSGCSTVRGSFFWRLPVSGPPASSALPGLGKVPSSASPAFPARRTTTPRRRGSSGATGRSGRDERPPHDLRNVRAASHGRDPASRRRSRNLRRPGRSAPALARAGGREDAGEKGRADRARGPRSPGGARGGPPREAFGPPGPRGVPGRSSGKAGRAMRIDLGRTPVGAVYAGAVLFLGLASVGLSAALWVKAAEKPAVLLVPGMDAPRVVEPGLVPDALARDFAQDFLVQFENYAP